MVQWLTDNWLEIMGWTGSFLVVGSLIVASVKRFRWLNLTGAILATAYNIILAIWPYAAMNGIVSLIDIYWLHRLYKESKDAKVATESGSGELSEKTFAVLDCTDQPLLIRFFLSRHRDEMARYFPNFDYTGAINGHGALEDGTLKSILVLRQDEIIGLVLVRELGNGTGEVVLDYVSKRFQDYTPGRFIYLESKVFSELGLETLQLNRENCTDLRHFKKIGFRVTASNTADMGDLLVLQLEK